MYSGDEFYGDDVTSGPATDDVPAPKPALTKFTVNTFINDGPGMLWGYEPGDMLIKGPVVVASAPNEESVLDIVWEAGNIGAAWSGKARSLSTGDVLAVVGGSIWAVASFGFDKISPDDFRLSRSGDAIHSDHKNRVMGRCPVPVDLTIEYDPKDPLARTAEYR